MGVNITSVVEVYDTATKTWKPEFKNLAVNPDHRAHDPENVEPYWMDPHSIVLAEKRHPGKSRRDMDTDELYGPYHIEQDNRVFAVLADVKNIDKDTPIAAARGLPRDISSETYQLYVQDKNNVFEMSYLTLAELQAYDWNQSCLWWDWRNGITKTSSMRGAINFQRLLTVMGRMGDLGEPDKVRLVFWFLP